MISVVGEKVDLGGGFLVHRILPQHSKRSVGPFIFLDHMGPVAAGPEQNIDVRPHPHIGLSTLTYLFEGTINHRDSLGNFQPIAPGEVNWMTAGRAISHSERMPVPPGGGVRRLHGLQFWVALPENEEEMEPAFTHYARAAVPSVDNSDHTLVLVAGEGFGLRSPVVTRPQLLFAAVESKRRHEIQLHARGFELGVYVVSGTIEVSGEVSGEAAGKKASAHELFCFDVDQKTTISAEPGARFVVIGGEPLKTRRHMWWNLVSTSREKIEEAKRKWRDGTFPQVVGDAENCPLPDNKDA